MAEGDVRWTGRLFYDTLVCPFPTCTHIIVVEIHYFYTARHSLVSVSVIIPSTMEV